MANFYVTALRESPHKGADRARPKVVSIDTLTVKKVLQNVNSITGSVNTIVKLNNRQSKTYYLAETYGQYLKASDFNNAASAPQNTGTSATVAASGATAAVSSTAITAYFNAVSAATAATMLGVKLPNASAAGRIGTPMVVFNAASTTIYVFPSASETLNSTTAGSVSIGVGRQKHFYCPTTTAWVECVGPTW